METIRSLTFLRTVLFIDAVSTGFTGLVSLLFAEVLAGLLQLPAPLVLGSAWVLVPFAIFVGYLASRSVPPRSAVWLVVAANVSWVIGCVALLFSGDVAPNVLGYVFIIGQAVIVGVFAELQFIGLRKQSAVAA